MKPWITLDSTTTPDGGTMTLSRRDQTYVIRINGHELMSTRHHASEDALATLTCAPLALRTDIRVLIGGLGCGFTLRAALATLGHDAQVVVAEVLPAVIAWNRNPSYPFAAVEMADPRVQLIEQDVAVVIRSHAHFFDVILLDVDNGAVALSVAQNQQLYQTRGLLAAHAALRPGGCLGIWSAQTEAALAALMRRAGFTVTQQQIAAHGTSGSLHTLVFGRIAA